MSGETTPGEKTQVGGAQGSSGEVIDLTNVPLKPLGKREISQLEMALIIGTLYRPEILELIRDPVERSTWVDSLAVAAGAYARMKAGLPVSQIAEELGRSETTIRSHLNMKTKAGKLVHETYEKLKKGELKLVVPFIRTPVAGCEEQVKALEGELEKQRNRLKELEAKISELTEAVKQREEEIQGLRSGAEALKRELEERVKELESCRSNVDSMRKTLEDAARLLQEALSMLQHVANHG
ncbi:transcriptional regulator [Desulfurococcus mucosus]|uniref:Transcriptional regulator, LuxR family n=1 Tax=Desulfurococcus mucosus (strain ATCC 35584 / DSM 2162 / JCM 9187 / O7/1) TaxID=765177 RepID=E8R7T6_DESM0|nr:transcriptional regulator [Desulfurococcus mucosus]ADV64562.1 transcriptional regulator, LuxR family [Desulfurococcus mucosus DSM 2162]